MKLIKTELGITPHDNYCPSMLEQQDTRPTKNKGWNMFEMWACNIYVGFDYEAS